MNIPYWQKTSNETINLAFNPMEEYDEITPSRKTRISRHMQEWRKLIKSGYRWDGGGYFYK